MITKYKKQVEPLIAIIAQPFLSWNPHLLTLMSVVCAIIFVVSLSWHNYLLAILSWLGVIFDALDGYVARKKGKATTFGAFFDSTTDRISDFCYISAFGFAGLVSWPIIFFALLTTYLISYVKARAEGLLSKNIVLQEGVMQRTERLGLLFFIFLLFISSFSQFGLVIFIVFIVLNILTIIQRALIIRKLL